jgi:hypothetical protein
VVLAFPFVFRARMRGPVFLGVLDHLLHPFRACVARSVFRLPVDVGADLAAVPAGERHDPERARMGRVIPDPGPQLLVDVAVSRLNRVRRERLFPALTPCDDLPIRLRTGVLVVGTTDLSRLQLAVVEVIAPERRLRRQRLLA